MPQVPSSDSIAIAPRVPAPILEFRRAELRAGRQYARLQALNLAVRPGECVHLQAEPHLPPPALAKHALGLLEPVIGEVLFQQTAWKDRTEAKKTQARGEVATIFVGEAWVSNLSVAENVTLATRFHGREPQHAALRRADQLAERLGLERTPRERAGVLPADRLLLSQWVRAFTLKPKLLLAEDPTLDLTQQQIHRLLALLQEQLQAGLAVLWISHEELASAPPVPGPAFIVSGDQVQPRPLAAPASQAPTLPSTSSPPGGRT